MANRLSIGRLLCLAILSALFILPERISLPAFAQSNRVDLNLVLAIDCSYSVDATEFELQSQGLALAFTNPKVIKTIEAGNYGRIAVTLVQWSSDKSQVVIVPWTLIDGSISAYKFAIAIKQQKRLTADGGTSISALIDRASYLLETAPYRAARYVMDISADGENNMGGWVDHARDRAVAKGFTVNGLVIMNDVSYLNYYFENHVIGGVGAFVEIAANYRSFSTAIRKKLLREITGNGIS